MRNAAFTTLNSYAYTLQASGHRTQVTESTGRTVGYTLDNQYRLTQETISGEATPSLNGTSDWEYDLVGNRLSQTSSLDQVLNATETYSDNNWLDSHTYDSNGNTIKSSAVLQPATVLQDTYDWRNRLIRREKSDGTIIEIVYDGFGDRVKKTVSGLSSQPSSLETTWFLVDRNNLTGYAQVVEEKGQGDELQVIYTYGLDLISQDRRDDDGSGNFTQSFYLYDGLGSIRALADSAGTITDEYKYDAWGVLIEATGTTENAYRFTGEQWDADLDMYFLRARYLNVSTGRFHTMDTFEGVTTDPVTLHKYLYANANPAMYVDPTGEMSLIGIATVVTIIGSLANMATPSVARFILGDEEYEALAECTNSFIEQYYTFGGYNTVDIIEAFAFTSSGIQWTATIADVITPWFFNPTAKGFNNPRLLLTEKGVSLGELRRKLTGKERSKLMREFRRKSLARLKATQRITSRVSKGAAVAALAGQAFVGGAYATAAAACLLSD